MREIPFTYTQPMICRICHKRIERKNGKRTTECEGPPKYRFKEPPTEADGRYQVLVAGRVEIEAELLRRLCCLVSGRDKIRPEEISRLRIEALNINAMIVDKSLEGRRCRK